MNEQAHTATGGGVSNAWSWRHAITKSDLAPTTRHVLLTLSVRMDETGGSCFPSTDELAEMTGLSKRAVVTHLGGAVEAGWLARRCHGYRGRKWRRDEYEARWPGREIAPETMPESEPESTSQEPEQGGEGGSPPHDEVVNVVPRGGERGSPRHVDQSNTSPEGEREARARDLAIQATRRCLAMWPTGALEDEPRAVGEMAKLTDAEIAEAEAALPAWLAFARARSRRHLGAFASYIGQQKWRKLPSEARQPGGDGGHEAQIPIERFTRVWFAVLFGLLERDARRSAHFFVQYSVRSEVWSVKASEVPDDARLAAMASVASDGPQWAAWSAWLRERDIRLSFERGRLWCFVPSEWPPGHEQARAADSIATNAEMRQMAEGR